LTTVYFDFETGGVEMRHPNISIAAIALENGREINSMHYRIRFDLAAADPEALRINHYDPALWEKEAISEEQATANFASFLHRHKCLTLTSVKTGKPYPVARLAGYNSASFDGPRASVMFDRWKIFPPFRRPTLDVLQLVLEHADTYRLPLVNFKLSTVAAHFGIDTTGAHDALADCRMTAAIHAAIIAKKEALVA
jgi:DNA polymerase III epsilon subunit-like protein